MGASLFKSPWTQGVLLVILFGSCWAVAPPAGDLDWTESFVLDSPIRFTPGFSVAKHFSVDAPGHFSAALLSRVVASGVEHLHDFENEGTVISSRVTSEGASVANGQFPPYEVMTRWEGYDYHSFGGFWAVPHRDYQILVRVEQAGVGAAAREGRLRIVHDPFFRWDGKPKAVIANLLGLAGIICALSLAARLWGKLWRGKEEIDGLTQRREKQRK